MAKDALAGNTALSREVGELMLAPVILALPLAQKRKLREEVDRASSPKDLSAKSRQLIATAKKELAKEPR